MGRLVILGAGFVLASTSCSQYRDIPVVNECETMRTIALEWATFPDELALEELTKYDVAARGTTVIEDVYPPGSASGYLFVWLDNGVRDYSIEPSADPILQVTVPRSACR